MDSAHGENLSEILQAQAHAWNHCFQFIVSMSLKCALELGIPDTIHNHGQPMTLSELVDALHINSIKAPQLFRLMRFLVHLGHFEVKKIGSSNEQEGYQLTKSSSVLLKDNPYTVRDFIFCILDPVLTKPWDYMSLWFQNDDDSPFFTAHQTGLWEYARKDERVNKFINESMVSDSLLVSTAVMSKCKWAFEGLKSLVDVGGNTGRTAKAVAEAFPSLDCTVLDLPHVISNLESSANLKYVGGDMFEAIPPADAVLFKWVLQDWSDEACVKVLKNSKEAIKSNGNGGKVIIIDVVLENQIWNKEETETQLMFDLASLSVLIGRQRNEKDWAKLFLDTGFSSYKIHPILHLRALIEVFP